MWLDLLLILLAISPLMRATRVLARDSGNLYARNIEFSNRNSELAPATRG
jgi:hypothetical protein